MALAKRVAVCEEKNTLINCTKMKKYNIGATLLALRFSKGKSQQQLASKMGVGQDYISYLENNKRKPSIDTLEKIVRFLDVSSLSEFFKLAENLYKFGTDKFIFSQLRGVEKEKAILKELINELQKENQNT